MSTSADHRAEALAALRLIQGADNPVAEMSSASEATAHALLAVEARLGQVVEQQRIANTIAAFQSGVVAPSEYDRAAAAARQLLNLPKEQPFT